LALRNELSLVAQQLNLIDFFPTSSVVETRIVAPLPWLASSGEARRGWRQQQQQQQRRRR
jgi:hypothetical protein